MLTFPFTVLILLFIFFAAAEEGGAEVGQTHGLYDLLKFHCFHFPRLIFPAQLHCYMGHTPPKERGFLPFFSASPPAYRVWGWFGRWYKSTFPQTNNIVQVWF